MNPDEVKTKRGRGRPKKAEKKAEAEVKTEKTKAKKTVAAKKKPAPSKPKVTRVAVKSPAELIVFMKDANEKLQAGKAAAPKAITTVVDELVNTADDKRERELVNQLRQLKALL